PAALPRRLAPPHRYDSNIVRRSSFLHFRRRSALVAKRRLSSRPAAVLTDSTAVSQLLALVRPYERRENSDTSLQPSLGQPSPVGGRLNLSAPWPLFIGGHARRKAG
ncbi:hypothetical protein THAOC_33801, partial [Thalassiosira oceanica]